MFIISDPDGHLRQYPLHMVDSIAVFGGVQLTTQAINTCLKEGVPVLFHTLGGYYNGGLVSNGYSSSNNIMLQCKFSENEVAGVEFGKAVVKAKINNQLTILRRYKRNHEDLLRAADENWEKGLKILRGRVDRSENRDELMGVEGLSGRMYFRTLSCLFEGKWQCFKGRSRRPPRDPFNAALSMGYMFLLNIITGKIIAAGLSPEIGFFHSNGYKRPSLSCDLIEEWRQPIIDSIVLSMMLGNEFAENDFERIEKGVYMKKSGIKKLIIKLHNRMESPCNYLSSSDRTMSFHEAVSHQIHLVKEMLRECGRVKYDPIMVR